MENINKYIGIPYKFNGRDFEGIDCLGLVQLFYKDHGWIDIDDGLPIIENEWQDEAPKRIVRWFGKYFDKIKDSGALLFGDVVIFKINNDWHFGIYISAGLLLSTQVMIGYENARSTLYKRWQWELAFKWAYRRRECN